MNKKEKTLAIIFHMVILFFVIIYIKQQNYEFMFYSVEAVILFWVLMFAHKTYKFPFVILIGFLIWLVSHMLGGTTINGAFVYGVMLFNLIGDPYYILKYDQLIHFYCYVVFGGIMYFILKKHCKKITGMSIFIAITAALGIGALNEIFEFSMVVLMPNTGVGGYYNIALDLVFNFAGAIVGVLLAKKIYN
jgi:hypothetical protein